MALGNIRQDFPALAHAPHLNTAGMAALPTSVADVWLRLPQYIATHGPALLAAHDEDLTRIEASHHTLAAFLGVDDDEVAFTTQFSTAVNIVVEGLPWQAGDEIIVSDQEHQALMTPIVNMAQRRGLIVHRFPVVDDDAAMLASFEALLNARTRLVAASHVTTETGTRVPVEAMTRLAHQAGALVLYDGAQSLGQFPINLRDLDCDFYALVGYKWLLGPYPSAALYLRRNMLDRIAVTWTGSRTTVAGGIDLQEATFIPGARRFEYGGRVFSHDAAMAAGIEYVSRLGLSAIEAHAKQLAKYLHEAIARIPGARVESTQDLSRANGIVTISAEGIPGTVLSPALRDRWGIITRPAMDGLGVRVSLAAFTNEEDLDLLTNGVATIIAGR